MVEANQSSNDYAFPDAEDFDTVDGHFFMQPLPHEEANVHLHPCQPGQSEISTLVSNQSPLVVRPQEGWECRESNLKETTELCNAPRRTSNTAQDIKDFLRCKSGDSNCAPEELWNDPLPNVNAQLALPAHFFWQPHEQHEKPGPGSAMSGGQLPEGVSYPVCKQGLMSSPAGKHLTIKVGDAFCADEELGQSNIRLAAGLSESGAGEEDKAEQPMSAKGPKQRSRTNKKALYWTPEDHAKFVAGLEEFGLQKGLGPGGAALMASYMGNRTVLQIKSHFQKYTADLAKGKSPSPGRALKNAPPAQARHLPQDL